MAAERWALAFAVEAGLARSFFARGCGFGLSGVEGLGATDGTIALVLVPGLGVVGCGVALEGAAFAVGGSEGFGRETGTGLARLGNEFADAGLFLFGSSVCGGDLDGAGGLVGGSGGGEEGREFAVDVEDGLAFDGNGLELTGCDERVDDVADARAGGNWGEEGFDVIFAGYDCLAEVEGDEGGESGWLAGVGSSLDLLGEAGRGQLPRVWLRRRAGGWG